MWLDSMMSYLAIHIDHVIQCYVVMRGLLLVAPLERPSSRSIAGLGGWGGGAQLLTKSLICVHSTLLPMLLN